MSESPSTIREKIISSALNAIAEHGVSNTTLQIIADGAGISKGSLYYHFKTKDSILYSVVDEDFRISRMIMQKYRAGELNRQQLREAIVAGFKERLEKKGKNRLHLYLAHEAMLGNQELMASYQAKYLDWVKDISEGFSLAFDVEQSEWTRLLAFFFISVMDGWCIQELLEIDAVPKKSAIKIMEAIFINEEKRNILKSLMNGK
ncbi:MAG TPA: TetR/AcrR family transcriptional regulator [Smithellaceae bacterium]|nr:TetR/AcrR family transcriptional regulator [Smithellaceae bacterium]HQM44368.1 TetR/AcrR family transcriptional regulator [Smithellaceae bacterium]